MSAADMIRRFREGKPTSREERAKQREAAGQERMWYEDNDQAGSAALNTKTEDSSDLNDSGNRPRSTLNIAPAAPSSNPKGALRQIRQPTDFMSSKLGDTTDSRGSNMYRDSTLGLGNSIDVNDLIENEIRQLEREVKDQDRATTARLSLGSFDPSRSIDRSVDSPMGTPMGYRFGTTGRAPGSLRGSRTGLSTGSVDGLPFAATAATRRSGAGPLLSVLPDAATRGTPSNDILSSSTGMHLPSIGGGVMDSIETLGSTGFKGLLVPELKLDGLPEKKKEGDGNMGMLNADLEELLKKLSEGKEKNSYFPDGVEENIPQITNKLHSEMLEFKSMFGNKHLDEDAAADEMKSREDALREEGRNEQRKQQLLELDLPAAHPLEYMGVWDGQQMQPTRPNQQRLDHFPHPITNTNSATPAGAPTAADGTGGVADSAEGNNAHGGQSPFASLDQQESLVLSPDRITAQQESHPAATVPASRPIVSGGPAIQPAGNAVTSHAQPTLPRALNCRPFAHGVGVMQAAVDVEMGAADSVLAKMRALRTGLGERMRHLDAMHASMNIGTNNGASNNGPQSWAPHSSAATGTATGTASGPGGPGGAVAAGLLLLARPHGPPLGPGRLPAGYPAATAAAGVSAGGAVSGGNPRGSGAPMTRPNPFLPGQYISSTTTTAIPAAGTGTAMGVNPLQNNPYWGLEDYYAALYNDWLAATEDTRRMWNPYPDLVHDNIFSVSKGITSVLDSAMDSLQHRLPSESDKRTDSNVQPPSEAGTSQPVPPVTPEAAPTSLTINVPEILKVAQEPVKAEPPQPEPSNLDAVVEQRKTTVAAATAVCTGGAEGFTSTVASPHVVAEQLVGQVLDASVQHVASAGANNIPPPPTATTADTTTAAATAAAPPTATTAATTTAAATAAATADTTAATTAAATVAPRSILATANAPPKPSVEPTLKQELAALDDLLGSDDSNSNYIGLDGDTPLPHATQLQRPLLPVKPVLTAAGSRTAGAVGTTGAAAAGGVVSSDNRNNAYNPNLAATDAYLQSRFPPNAWDPRVQYAARRQQRLQSPAEHPSSDSTVIHAPATAQLPQTTPAASAPPVNILGAFPASPTSVQFASPPGPYASAVRTPNQKKHVGFSQPVPVSMPSYPPTPDAYSQQQQQQQQQVPAGWPTAGTGDTGTSNSNRNSGFPSYDDHRMRLEHVFGGNTSHAVEATRPLPLVRPLEGTAILNARAAAAATRFPGKATGAGFIPSPMEPLPQSPHNNSSSNHNGYFAGSNRSAYTTQPAFQQGGGGRIDSSIHEKEMYLRQMQALRQKLTLI